MDNLVADKIKKLSTGQRIYVFQECSSTMEVGWHLLGKGELKELDSVLALRQFAGRGQWRRKWVSPPGNLYVSILFSALRKWEQLSSLFLGFLVQQSLANMGFFLSLKWPNDLIYKEKKVGGILLEERKDKLLAGIGLNLKQAPQLEERIFPAGSLELPEVDVLEFWLKLKQHLLNLASTYFFEDSQVLIDRINQVLAFQGRKVVIEDGETRAEGILTGLGPKGELLVLEKGRIKTFFNGSVVAFKS
jgi:BirA family biotin operon repressor/biotin-[acetyl-CoA-carboxylase] ligase